MSSLKYSRALHTARQIRLHKTDRCKHRNRLKSAISKPWKSSKGYSLRSGQIVTPRHNYGRRIDNAIHENILHPYKTYKAYRYLLDDEDIDMDVAYERSRCEELEYEDEGPRQCGVEIDLMSIARPARARKNKKQSRVSRVYASPALERVVEQHVEDVSDTDSSTTESDIYSDFGWDDRVEARTDGSYTSEEGEPEDDFDHPLEGNDFFPAPGPLLAELLPGLTLVDEESATSLVQLEPLLTELGNAHEEFRHVPRRVFSPAPLSPFSDDDDADSSRWDDFSCSESEHGSDEGWVDLSGDGHVFRAVDTSHAHAAMLLEAT